MPRPHREIAKIHDTTLDVIKKLSASGVNVYDEEAVAEALKKKVHKLSTDAKLGDYSELDTSVQDLEEQLNRFLAISNESNCQDEIKICQLKIVNIEKGIKILKELKKLISIQEVDERDTRAAASVRAAIMKMTSEIPPQVTGLTSPEIKDVITPYCYQILTDLTDDQNQFWSDDSLSIEIEERIEWMESLKEKTK